MRLILRKLKLVCKNPTELSKYLKQLIVLSRLRKAEDLTTKIAEEMPITFDLKTDALYKKGEANGIEQGIERERLERQRAFTQSLIEDTDFLDEKIASLVSVDIVFVQQMRAELKQLKK